ncbi:MAG: tRNA guanosine(34) transglycosylase Tgt [Saprospiraceae bacterium]|jgi:queuine tRNA-ribosyltransferase|nr:tRNA guanosine(34) transglycosylase Tgt [Saprospiraceae bacterium]MBK6477286.1 tRNA guanosine(34) transglycosylase Tgt [Saprospiraceae bacterium]MBK6814406.1 tRNA guanosine(34) transglycosylase Tgt [Saprospiraceae bacterium]MBK7373825.1 tRNA guanosine(34) transglycosylase Tgt [Saprospiraceae bacterium]MBK7437501.1 tRNA guanosine(34) transglycosylase Tgt [Saprospiraceae bacterium]
MGVSFTKCIDDKDSKARTGLLHTDHGTIETPIFMPVGTGASVKGVSSKELTDQVHAQIILSNTYHLYLRPGPEVLSAAGGIHKFMQWHKPVLTDSGGYQVYSLSNLRKIKEEGVAFSSHIDGSKHLFTPESVVDIQLKIGADLIMAFDECPPYPSEYAYAKNSMELTHRWWARCHAHFEQSAMPYDYQPALIPICQGSVYKDLRTASAQFIASYDTPVKAIGGLSVGEKNQDMYDMIECVNEHLPEDKARYLMGVGTPENILLSIEKGIDMFDCVLPTRNARHGLLYTSQGIINIKNARWKFDQSIIDPGLPESFALPYSKSYLRHLIQTNELMGARIATLQNLSLYLYLVKTAREKIEQGVFSTWKNKMIDQVTCRLD